MLDSLPTSTWPSMEVLDDIEKASLQTFIQLRDSGTSLRASPQSRPPHAKDVHQPLESAYPPDYIPPTSKHPSPAVPPVIDIDATRFGSTLL